MLLTEQTDKLIDKYKEVCQDRHCLGLETTRTFRGTAPHSSSEAVFILRNCDEPRAGHFSADTTHNTDCSWK